MSDCITTFEEYKARYFPRSDFDPYKLPPEEFGDWLAEQWMKSYRESLQAFLEELERKKADHDR